jgi:LacI family transcriptional regulator
MGKTRLRVIAAAEKLGCRTNCTAWSLKTQSAMTVAAVFPELANDFYMDAACGIEGELDVRGCAMLMASSLNAGVERPWI